MGSFFEILIPVKSWLHDRGWRQGIRLLIIPYALLPLIFLGLFSTSGNLTTPGWAYSLYIAPLWLLTFWYLIRPPVVGKLEALVAAGIIVWTIIWLHVVTIYVNDHFANTHNILGSLVVGYNEESTKAIPVLVAAIFVLKVRKKKLDPRTWFLMGTVAGPGLRRRRAVDLHPCGHRRHSLGAGGAGRGRGHAAVRVPRLR